MSLDDFKKFGLDTAKHSESKVKRFRSMFKLLEQDGIVTFPQIHMFIDNIESEKKTEEISNIFNTRFGTSYAHASARDLFNCLKSTLNQFNLEVQDSQKRTSPTSIDTEAQTCTLTKVVDISEVTSLANELLKNNENQNIDSDLKTNISRLILEKMQVTISKLL